MRQLRLSLKGLQELSTTILTNKYYTFAFFFFLTLLIRLTTFLLIPVDWNWDSYHHWQIAYYTLKIGLGQGRMWDLGGMEYFWGVVPHLIEAFIFWVLNTTSILPYRVLNIILGSITVWLIYLIGRDQFNWKVGLYAAFFSALCPVFVIFDILALQDTTALFFAVTAFYLHKKQPFFSGILFGLASQSRIELWLISPLFIFSILLYGRDMKRFSRLLFGWLTVIVPFMWFFWTRTGNPIYPLYWSFYDAFGGWSGTERPPLSTLVVRFLADWSQKLVTDPKALGLLSPVLLSTAALLYMLKRPPKKYPLYVLFLLSFLFCGFYTLQYLRSLFLFLIVLRIIMLPVAIGSLILAYLALKPRLRALHLEKVLLIVFFALWLAAIPAYQSYQHFTTDSFQVADEAMKYYSRGRIVCDVPTIVHRIVDRWSVPLTNLMSSHYSPLYYGNRTPKALVEWFRSNNITLWIYVPWQNAPEVLKILQEGKPSLLILRATSYDVRIFEVNSTALSKP